MLKIKYPFLLFLDSTVSRLGLETRTSGSITVKFNIIHQAKANDRQSPARGGPVRRSGVAPAISQNRPRHGLQFRRYRLAQIDLALGVVLCGAGDSQRIGLAQPVDGRMGQFQGVRHHAANDRL